MKYASSESECCRASLDPSIAGFHNLIAHSILVGSWIFIYNEQIDLSEVFNIEFTKGPDPNPESLAIPYV